MRPTPVLFVLASVALSAAHARASDAPAVVATPAAAAPSDPVVDKAQALREAASLLEKAATARGRGNKSFAEQLFSSAEVLVGPEALAQVAQLFREGAPPRISTPTQKFDKNAPAQPVVAGNSDEDEPEPKPLKGSIAGTLIIEGAGGDAVFGVVTLEPSSGKAHRRGPRRRVMEQRNRQFAPRVVVVPVGSTVVFPNFDPVYHNVFSASEARSFDLGIYKNGEAREITFDKEGIVSVSCNLHANMTGHIVVVSAPHYAIADDKSRFAFRSVAPGRYRLRAWSTRSLHPVTQEIDVKPDRNVVTIKVAGDAPNGPLPDKFGVSRASKP